MKCRSMASVISKSAITPSFIGRIATMLPGVRPSILFASSPTARTFVVPDRKSTRLNSSHSQISYAVFCLKKKICVSHIIIDHVSAAVSAARADLLLQRRLQSINQFLNILLAEWLQQSTRNRHKAAEHLHL